MTCFYLTEIRLAEITLEASGRCLAGGPVTSRQKAEAYRRRGLVHCEFRARESLAAEINEKIEENMRRSQRAYIQGGTTLRTCIRHHLEEHGYLSRTYAREVLGISHPAGRIRELREAGFRIKRVHRKLKYADGQKRLETVYLLEGKREDH